MYVIDRINGYQSYVDYTGTRNKVKQINKDEKNKQQDKRKKESFKDVFERTQSEKKKQ